MNRNRVCFGFAAVTAMLAVSSSLRAQCAEWSTRFTMRGPDDYVLTTAVFDDGTGIGPSLFAGGWFVSVGDVPAALIARWNGTTWSPLAGQLSGSTLGQRMVNALAAYDDGVGSGPCLYVGGDFVFANGVTVNGIARWSGENWSPLATGMNGIVTSLAVYDDGSGGGPALYASGNFTIAGGVFAKKIAKWNGTSWSTLGSGLQSDAHALAVYDAGLGQGPELIAAGSFQLAGGMAVQRIARWNGSTWSPLGSGLGGTVDALAVVTPASGPARLYVGGSFTTAGGVSAANIASWDGTSFAAVGSGLPPVRSLTSFDDGSGSGSLIYAGTTPFGVHRFDGATWSSLGSAAPAPAAPSSVRCLGTFDDGSGSGEVLHAGGLFSALSDEGTAHNFARWTSSGWTPVVATGAGIIGNVVNVLIQGEDSTTREESLFAGGAFREAGGQTTNGVARWNGAQWTALGSGGTSGDLPANALITAMCLYDDGLGGGSALYVSGNLSAVADTNYLARWNGSAWTNVTSVHWSDPNDIGGAAAISALRVFDDGTGPALFVGGFFDSAGGVSANNVAKWNGSSWQPLGFGVNGSVLAFAVFDNGSGPALHVGGNFTTAGGASAKRIAKWNGTSWSALGTGIDGGLPSWTVRALEVFDSGSGPSLYAAGSFGKAGDVFTNGIAKWNGVAWSSVGTGGTGLSTNGNGSVLRVIDAGGGPALYLGGTFSSVNGLIANDIAKWDGTSWSTLGGGSTGLYSSVYAIAGYDDSLGGGTDVYAGGTFKYAGNGPSSLIGQWFGCEHSGYAYCFGDGVDPVVTAQCPCTNFGAPNHGCANSTFASGARLHATGTTSPNTILFTMTNVPNNTLATGFRNLTNTNPGGVVFGDGVRCQSGALIRFSAHNTGTLGDAPNTWSSPTDTLLPGLTRYYQVQYRNPAPAFCPPATFNISNGYQLLW